MPTIIPINETNELINNMDTANQRLKEINDSFDDIKDSMNDAWGEDTQWTNNGTRIVDRIKELNLETIELFTGTILGLEDWLGRILTELLKAHNRLNNK